MTTTKRADTVRLQTLTKAYWESAALMAAIELKIFSAIERGQDTVASTAAAVGISERNAERLLTALTAMEIVRRDGNRFVNAEDVDCR